MYTGLFSKSQCLGLSLVIKHAACTLTPALKQGGAAKDALLLLKPPSVGLQDNSYLACLARHATMMGNYVSGHSRSCRLITKPTVQRKTSLEMLTDPIKKKHLKRNQVLPHSETVPQTGVCCASGTLTLNFKFSSQTSQSHSNLPHGCWSRHTHINPCPFPGRSHRLHLEN